MATETDTSKKKIEEEYEKIKKKSMPLFLLQTLFAFFLNAFILGGGYYYLPSLLPVPESDDFVVKLIYTLRCFVFPQAIVLFFAIARVANRRGSTPAGNPLIGQDANYLLAEKNALTNTVEQVLTFFLLVVVLITFLEPSEMKIIPLLSLMFVIGRILFIFGYSVGPLYRVAGMISNFVSVWVIIGSIGYMMYSRGLMYKIPFSATSGGFSPDKTEL